MLKGKFWFFSDHLAGSCSPGLCEEPPVKGDEKYPADFKGSVLFGPALLV